MYRPTPQKGHHFFKNGGFSTLAWDSMAFGSAEEKNPVLLTYI